MKQFTLRQLCNECGVSRRAVQGYEKYGLVRSIGKTDRGYLLYDQDAKKKVELIKSLQNYGFTVKEICEFLNADTEKQHGMLREKLKLLKVRKEMIETYIAEIQKTINSEP